MRKWLENFLNSAYKKRSNFNLGAFFSKKGISNVLSKAMRRYEISSGLFLKNAQINFDISTCANLLIHPEPVILNKVA